MGAVVSLPCLCPVFLPPQGEDSSQSAPASAWGASHRRQSSMNFSSMSPSHRCSHTGADCSSVGPCRVTGPASSPATAQPPLSTAPARILLPKGSQSPLGIHLLWCGVLPKFLVGLWYPVDLHGLLGNLCSCIWSTACPTFFSDFGVCRAVSLTYFLSFLCL